MTAEEQRELEVQLEEMWALVDELGELSVRLRVAADNAIKALGLPEKGEYSK